MCIIYYKDRFDDMSLMRQIMLETAIYVVNHQLLFIIKKLILCI